MRREADFLIDSEPGISASFCVKDAEACGLRQSLYKSNCQFTTMSELDLTWGLR